MIETGGMSEGTQALLWVIGLLVTGGGGYFVGRKREVRLEPNRVEVAPDSCTLLRENLEKQVGENSKAVSDLSLRLSMAEKEIAYIKGEMPHITRSLTRIEGKLDTVIGRSAP